MDKIKRGAAELGLALQAPRSDVHPVLPRGANIARNETGDIIVVSKVLNRRAAGVTNICRGDFPEMRQPGRDEAEKIIATVFINEPCSL